MDTRQPNTECPAILVWVCDHAPASLRYLAGVVAADCSGLAGGEVFFAPSEDAARSLALKSHRFKIETDKIERARVMVERQSDRVAEIVGPVPLNLHSNDGRNFVLRKVLLEWYSTFAVALMFGVRQQNVDNVLRREMARLHSIMKSGNLQDPPIYSTRPCFYNSIREARWGVRRLNADDWRSLGLPEFHSIADETKEHPTSAVRHRVALKNLQAIRAAAPTPTAAE